MYASVATRMGRQEVGEVVGLKDGGEEGNSDAGAHQCLLCPHHQLHFYIRHGQLGLALEVS